MSGFMLHRSRNRLPPLMIAMALGVIMLTDALVAGFSCAPMRPSCISLQGQPSIAKPTVLPSPMRYNGLASYLSSLSSTPSDEEDEITDIDIEVVEDTLTPAQVQSIKSKSLLSNIKDFFTNKTKFNRESLGKLGMSALLAYGFVSNVSGVLAVSSAWFIFCKKTGVSPMAPGQKPAFLAVYAGFTVMLNVIRPARFALSMAISPYFERIRKSIQNKFGVSPRAAAVLMIIFINLIGTCSLMALGVGLASVLSGVPVWAGK